MKELTAVLATARGSTKERAAARRAFLQRRAAIWADIQAGRFPAAYRDASGRKFVGASRRTAVRCDFLRANKIALGSKYRRDVIADQAQRDFLFYVLRDRETFPHRTGMKFWRPRSRQTTGNCSGRGAGVKATRSVTFATWPVPGR